MNTPEHGVLLNSARPPAAFSRQNVYFAFASGRFTYDCVSCNAKCCRGHGYQLQVGRELQAHVTTRPSVRFFVEPQDGGADKPLRVRNCPPSCFFLNEKSLCSIHAEHGYDAKPETCRLFPFNGLRASSPCCCNHLWISGEVYQPRRTAGAAVPTN